MPIFISAKETLHPASEEKKKQGFPDMPPTWGVSLFGPREMWNDGLRKHLAFEGLMRGKSNRVGQETWYLRSTICPPPLHLLMTARTHANVVATKEFAAMFKAATERAEYEDEYGLRFKDAGDDPLKVDFLATFFIANCSSGNKARERMMVAAGFRRLRLDSRKPVDREIIKRFGSMPMTTAVGMIAARFREVMTDKAKREVMRALKEEAQNVVWSKATDIPENYPIQSIPMPEGEALQPFQVVGAGNILRQNRSGMILDDMGLGKAQPLDAKILTPSGWRLMKDIKVGDEVIGSAGKPIHVTGVFPQGVKDIYKVTFDDESVTQCCDEHLWSISKNSGDNQIWSVATLSEISEIMRKGTKVEIPVVDPVEFTHSSELKYHEQSSIFHAAKNGSWVVGGSIVPSWTSIDQFLCMKKAYRQKALQGAIHYHGKTTSEGDILLHVSELAALEITEIVRSLGGISRRKEVCINTGNTILCIHLPWKISPFRFNENSDFVSQKPRRFISKVENVRRYYAQCISVDAPDQLYVTDDYIVTHNTIQYIAVLNGRQDFRKILITCKANMKGGWKKAVERFCVRDEPLKVGVVFGDDWPEDADVIIINYDICDRHKDKLRSTLWDSWGIDEGHSISNEDASRTQALLGDFKDRVKPPRGIRVRKGGLIVNLTGTPHPKVTRRWTTLSLVRPDIWGRTWQDKIDFMNRYAPARLIAQERTNGRGQSYISIVPLEGEPMREAEFQYLLRATGTMTRRLKSSMAHLLPPKSRYAIELPIQMTEQAYAELAEAEADITAILNEVRATKDMAGLEAIESDESIAQAIIDTVKGMPPNSPDFEKISRLRSNIGKIKAPFVADYVIQSVEGDDELPPEARPKSVIFAHHKEVIATIRDRIEAAMPGSTIVYDGAVSEKKRDKLVDEFQTMHKRRFFIMSLSGASGITLTAANRLYVAEMDWDPLNIAQIEDRIWRIGQMLPCLIGYMFAPRTMDLMVGNTIVKKMTTLMRAYDKMDLSGVKPGTKAKAARDVFEIGQPGDLPGAAIPPERTKTPDPLQGELTL